MESQEWLTQASYDFDAARYMFDGKRYGYAVFMCHLCIEKALKGMYQKMVNEVPPKTHNLIYLIEEMHVDMPESMRTFLVTLNQVSVVTRYPDDLARMQHAYTEQVVQKILQTTEEILLWIKKQH